MSSAFSFRDIISRFRHQAPGGNHLVRADYLELGTLSGESPGGKRNGLITTIEGGVGALSRVAGGTLNRDGVSDDGMYLADGIKKTVCLESQPQQTEDSRTP